MNTPSQTDAKPPKTAKPWLKIIYVAMAVFVGLCLFYVVGGMIMST